METTQNRADQAVDLVSQGIPVAEVADRLGVTPQSVYSALKIRERGGPYKRGRKPQEVETGERLCRNCHKKLDTDEDFYIRSDGKYVTENVCKKCNNDLCIKKTYRRKYKQNPTAFKNHAARQSQLVHWMLEVIKENESVDA